MDSIRDLPRCVSPFNNFYEASQCQCASQSEFYPVQQSVAQGRRLPSLFSTTSEPFHSQLRRSVNSAFSMSTLIQYEPFVDSTTELFLSQTEKIYAECGVGCDFSRWLQFYAFDVIGEMTYSKRHGFLEENKDIDGIIDYIANLFNYVAPVLSPVSFFSTSIRASKRR
jgi:hypothetical protein